MGCAVPPVIHEGKGQMTGLQCPALQGYQFCDRCMFQVGGISPKCIEMRRLYEKRQVAEIKREKRENAHVQG